MNPSQCCCAAEISVYGGEDPELLRAEHLVLSTEEKLIDNWLEEKGISMANPVDNIYQYFKQKKESLVQQNGLKKPSSLLERRKQQLKVASNSPVAFENSSSKQIQEDAKQQSEMTSQFERLSFSSTKSFDSNGNAFN